MYVPRIEQLVQRFFKLFHVAAFGGNCQLVLFECGWGIQVAFVVNFYHRLVRGEGGVVGRILHQIQYHVGAVRRHFGAAYALRFHLVGGVVQPCGVHKVEFYVAVEHAFAKSVPRGALYAAYYRPVAAQKGVEQAGFSHVGSAHYRHVYAVFRYLAQRRGGNYPVQSAAHVVDLPAHLFRRGQLEVFFGIV